MKHTNYYPLIILGFASCATPRAYIMSPMDITTHSYQTLPSTADSQKAATYASIALNAGGSNEKLRDNVLGMRAAISRSYRFGNFQAYYGGGLNLGNYRLSDEYYYSNRYYSNNNNDTVYHYPGANRFYGAYGFNGGINLVIPFGNGRGEWRALGVETSYQKEFGDYVRFRKQIPDSVVDILASYGQIFTLGGSTEIVGISRHGTEIGYKVAVGGVFYPRGSYLGPNSNVTPYYMSHTVHVTKRKVTGFFQFNFGTHAANCQFGVNYNLSKRKD
jgi:hypothetical protein